MRIWSERKAKERWIEETKERMVVWGCKKCGRSCKQKKKRGKGMPVVWGRGAGRNGARW